MPQHRLDPQHPESVRFSTKLGKSDAERLTELARQAGVGRSEFIRAALLRELGRAEPEPPDEQAA